MSAAESFDGNDMYCPACGAEMDWEDCDSCGGEGTVEEEEDGYTGRVYDVPCYQCHGLGGWHFCYACRMGRQR